jgi:hypothetical protein
VMIAWPAMLAALALISLPFIGGYLLVRRLSTDSGAPGAGPEPDSEDTGSEGEEESGNEERQSEDEEEDSEEDGDPDESEDAVPDAEKAAG